MLNIRVIRYNDRMSTAKKILYHFVGFLFKLGLIVLPLVFAVAVVFGSPASIEKALKESRVYEQFVTIVLDNSEKQAADSDAKQLLSDPEVRAAIEKSFPSSLLERSTSTVIGGVYAWLQGDTPEPQFAIDFSEAKNSLVANLTDVAKRRASGLPECTLAQLQTLNQNTDLLSLPCRPPGFDVDQAADQFGNQILSDVEFLDKPVISNETLTKDGQPLIGEDLQQLPKAYQAAQAAKWVLLALVAGLGLLLIFARHDRRAGLRHVAWATLGAGMFLGITLAVYWFAFDQANKTVAGIDATRAMVLDGAQVVMRDLNAVIITFVIVYLVASCVTLAFLHFRRKPVQQDSPEREPADTNNSEKAQTTPPSDKIS